jgi:hexosaminidase
MLEAARAILRHGVRLALILATPAAAFAASLDVIPRPLSVTGAADSAPVAVGPGTLVISAPGDPDAAEVADYLAALVLRSEHLRLEPRVGTVPAAPADQHPVIVLARARLGAAEGYAVDVGQGRVTITARTRAGLLYGAVTVWQMLSGHDAAVPLPAVHIEDAPRFGWRGLMIDSVRHFQSPAFIERTIDWMALHKLNHLQWHLTDDQGWRLQIDRYPRLTSVGAWRSDGMGGRYGGFYTKAQVRHLVAYAAARNITIVPEIEMPGHALSAILAYPGIGLTGGTTAAQQGDWGIFPSIYNPDEATIGFMQNVLAEVMALFPSKVIAVGGDEAVKDAWHASPAVQARMKALGLADETAMQAYFTRRIGSFLNSRGRRLIGWDEILQGGTLPAGDAVLSWHGADGAITAVRAGHDVVMATAPTLYFDNRQSGLPGEPPGRGPIVSLRDVYDYDAGHPPLPATAAAMAPLTAAEQHHVLGLQANIWTEHLATEARVEAMALPRVAALAESGWTASGNRDWADFARRLPSQMARYRALGLHADDGAVALGAQVEPVSGRAAATVALSNQLGSALRFTTDGRAPTGASPQYRGPVEVALPAHLQAAAFDGARQISPLLDRRYDAVSVRHRVSQELKLCSDRVSLNLAGKAVAGTQSVYLIDIMNPCWIYAGADLTAVRRISAQVAALPFNYQLGADRKTIALRPPATPAGELVIRQDACDGPVLAVLPLTALPTDGTPSTLASAVAPAPGKHDLCLTFTARQLDPMWALGSVQLDPGP